MLSKRMTAKSLELKPASQARNRMVKDSKDCHPAGCDRPPDRAPTAPALLPLSAAAALLRPFPEYDAPELSEDLCLLSETGWCSAIFYVSPVVEQASEASYLLSYRKEVPPFSFFRCHAPLPKPLAPPFPPQPRAPRNTGYGSQSS